MSELGELTLFGAKGGRMLMVVFDDALVVVGESTAGKTGILFGAVGGVARGLAFDRTVKQVHEATASGAITAEGLAGAFKGSELIPLAAVSSLQMEKALGKARKMMLTTSDGRQRSYRYAHQAQAKTVELLRPLLGDRLVNTLPE